MSEENVEIVRALNEAVELMGTFWQSFEYPRSEIEDCIASGDDVVLAVRIYGRGKASSVGSTHSPAGAHVAGREGRAVEGVRHQSGSPRSRRAAGVDGGAFS
jgi:hypothetical protein